MNSQPFSEDPVSLCQHCKEQIDLKSQDDNCEHCGKDLWAENDQGLTWEDFEACFPKTKPSPESVLALKPGWFHCAECSEPAKNDYLCSDCRNK